MTKQPVFTKITYKECNITALEGRQVPRQSMLCQYQPTFKVDKSICNIIQQNLSVDASFAQNLLYDVAVLPRFHCSCQIQIRYVICCSASCSKICISVSLSNIESSWYDLLFLFSPPILARSLVGRGIDSFACTYSNTIPALNNPYIFRCRLRSTKNVLSLVYLHLQPIAMEIVWHSLTLLEMVDTALLL